jgi:hypothetical protein
MLVHILFPWLKPLHCISVCLRLSTRKSFVKRRSAVNSSKAQRALLASWGAAPGCREWRAAGFSRDLSGYQQDFVRSRRQARQKMQRQRFRFPNSWVSRL